PCNRVRPLDDGPVSPADETAPAGGQVGHSRGVLGPRPGRYGPGLRPRGSGAAGAFLLPRGQAAEPGGRRGAGRRAPIEGSRRYSAGDDSIEIRPPTTPASCAPEGSPRQPSPSSRAAASAAPRASGPTQPACDRRSG